MQFQKIIRNSTNSGYSGQHLVFKMQRNKTSWAELCQAQGKLRLVGLRIDLCLLWVTNMFLFLPIWIRISILAIYSAAFGRIGMVILCSYVWFPVFGLKACYIKNFNSISHFSAYGQNTWITKYHLSKIQDNLISLT